MRIESIQLIKGKNNLKNGLVPTLVITTFGVVNFIRQNPDGYYGKIFAFWIVLYAFIYASWCLNFTLPVFLDRTRYKGNRFNELIFNLFANVMLLLFLFAIIIITRLYEISAFSPDKPYLYFSLGFRLIIGFSVVNIIFFAQKANEKAQDTVLQNQLLKTENIKSQFESLRQQIHPHFLFNSLSVLRSMIRSNDANAELFVIKLSELYRQLLMNREKDLISLKEELELTNDYTFLLLARFEKMLFIHKDIPAEIMKMQLPTLGLQLLLENCIKHNVVSHKKPLAIKIYTEGTSTITVENSLQPRISSEEPSEFGLASLIKRYSLLGFPQAVTIFSDKTIFRVTLKLIEP